MFSLSVGPEAAITVVFRSELSASWKILSIQMKLVRLFLSHRLPNAEVVTRLPLISLSS